jgi:carboxypeptidase Q
MRTYCLYLPVLVFFAALSLNAQNSAQTSSYDQEPQAPKPKTYASELTQNLMALRDAALTDDYAYRQVAYLTDNIGPRPTGWPQTEAAVQYVAAELRKLGLEVHLEEVHVPRWTRGAESGELVEYPGQAPGTSQKIVLTALGGNTPTAAGGLTADVVVATSFDQLRAMGRPKVEGKIVLFNVAFDEQKAVAGFWDQAYGEAVQYRSRGAKESAALGAVACLVRSVGGADYRLPHTGHNIPAGIPAGAVTAEDADLIAHLAAQGKVRMHLVMEAHTGEDTVSYNVIGDLKGSEHPEQVVVVSGHLDSWDLGTGAIDDAAGVGVAMETAELVHRLGLHPRRTIRVIAWMDEENGGHGHDTYAKDYAGEFGNHVAAIESDLGSDHPLGFNVKMSFEATAWLAPVQQVLSSFGANLIRPTNYSPGADIAPLAEAGVPTLGIIQDGRTYFNYHHTAADTLDKVNPQTLRENAAAMAVMGYAIADMEERLPR